VLVRLLSVILRGLSAFPQFLVQVWLDFNIWHNTRVPIRSCSFLLSSMRSISLTAHIDSWYANLFCAVSLFIFYIINIYSIEVIPDTRLRHPRGGCSSLLPFRCWFVVVGGGDDDGCQCRDCRDLFWWHFVALPRQPHININLPNLDDANQVIPTE